MNLEDFKKLLSSEYDNKEIDKIILGLSKKRYVTLRVNTLKSNMEEVKKALDEVGIEYQVVNWYKNALIIKNSDEKNIETLKIYEDGEIYLQSLSSMLPVLILDPKEGENILDMTAAPGSKTTQIAIQTNNKAIITAVEKNKIRCDRLIYNIKKMGAKKINVLREDARWLDEQFSFDKILLDAPCSGSGTIYINDDKIQDEGLEELILRMPKVQEQLFRKAMQLLKLGGEMVYSTCSIIGEENYKLINKMQEEFKFEIVNIDLKQFEDLPIINNGKPGITLRPNEYFEGFYVIKIKKIK